MTLTPMDIHTLASETDRSYTLTPAADLIGIPRPTLLTWLQKYPIPCLWQDRDPGETRQLGQSEVLSLAIFALVAQHDGPSTALRVVQEVMISFLPTPKWAVWFSDLKPGQDAWIIAESCRLPNGGEHFEVRVAKGDVKDLGAAVDALITSSKIGRICEDTDDVLDGMDNQLSRVGDGVSKISIYPAGEAVRRTLRAMERTSE